MSSLAMVVAIAAVIGAVVSWIVGALNFLRTLRVLSGHSSRKQMWYAAIAWPFASRQVTAQTQAYATNVNKALVAFFTSVMIAAAAFSLSANLSRFAR